MKKLFFLLILNPVLLRAQTGFGLQAGLVAANMRQRSEQTNCAVGCDKGTRIGFKAGAFANVSVTKNLSINAALNLIEKGGKYRLNAASQIPPTVSNCVITLHFLEVPLDFLYKLENGPSGFYVGVGPVFGIGLNGKRVKTVETISATGSPSKTVNTNKVIFDGKNQTGDDLHFRKTEWGADIFVGYALLNGLRLQVQARPDFTNLYPDNTNGTYRNFYFGLTAGYFILGKR